MAANPIALLARGPNHRYGQLGLPQNPPQNPPTLAEVMEAVRLANCVLRYCDNGAPPTSNEHVSDEAVAACFYYEKAVLESAAGVAALWFQKWCQASFIPLVNDVNTLKDSVNALRLDMSMLLIRDGKERNAQRTIVVLSVRFPFQMVGSHGALVLTDQDILDNQASIDNLTHDQSYAYLAGYYPNMPVLNTGPNTLHDWKLAIAHAIGHVA
ncbi:hypothetical protein C8R41DRAFT_913345 [Lentinula lateritia]|uniref:Mug135-like C-terminal domain-containing protein n=1 Tax=Lentinula lateritia TaxID=40482 RepID=A0ABQ8W0D8_9AGAR|nr:hypothetical protein C8R41DRAFT_913345 [Lentinula lateritia]